jgi:hypothetical protein
MTSLLIFFLSNWHVQRISFYIHEPSERGICGGISSFLCADLNYCFEASMRLQYLGYIQSNPIHILLILAL